ncbi:MAG: hypothetical protein M3361_15690 [Candidatus Tectomicrobia bacterium]|nr:hypothetical protein [Candidatus Tectomicrobia bacterium]
MEQEVLQDKITALFASIASQRRWRIADSGCLSEIRADDDKIRNNDV